MIRLSELCDSYTIRISEMRLFENCDIDCIACAWGDCTEEGGFTTQRFGEIRGEVLWGTTPTTIGWFSHHYIWRSEYGIAFYVTLHTSFFVFIYSGKIFFICDCELSDIVMFDCTLETHWAL